jgi:hypothetical protein
MKPISLTIIFLASAFSLQILAMAAPTEPDEPDSPFSQEYFEKAKSIVHRFLPNAEFYFAESIKSPVGDFCPSISWEFKFLDKQSKESVQIEIGERDETVPGGNIDCKMSYDLRITPFEPNSSLETQPTFARPENSMAVSYLEAVQIARSSIGADFKIISADIWVQRDNNIYITLYGRFESHTELIVINMTTGEIDI